MKKILMILLLTVFAFSFSENLAPQYRYTVVVVTMRYDGYKVDFKLDTKLNEIPDLAVANAVSELADSMQKRAIGHKEI